jgi:hypothetical protein
MTFIEAASKILIDEGNMPMTPKDIWSKICERNLYTSKGKSPAATLTTVILRSSTNRNVSYHTNNIIFDIIDTASPFKVKLVQNTMPVVVPQDEVISEKILLYQITCSETEWKTLSIYNNNENIEYDISNCGEYTYIIEDKAHATVKIGKTKNDPILRLNQLKTANPSISLLHVFPASQFSESELHDKFSDFQKDLEWFFFAKSIKSFLSTEITKHNSILKAFSKRKILDLIELEMLSELTNNI